MCEHCGDITNKCEVIGVYDVDYVAFVDHSQLCPMCDGTAFLRLETWKYRKPCPVCKGVGQLKTSQIPTKHQMIQMVLEITPVKDRVALLESLTGG